MLVALALTVETARVDGEQTHSAPRRQGSSSRYATSPYLRLAAGVLVAVAGIAHAQIVTDLPPPPTTVRPGDLPSYLELPNSDVPTPGLAWQFQPSLSVTQAYQNIRQNGINSSQFTTTIAPAISISGQTSRITTNINYSPQLVISDDGNSDTYVAQIFNGTGHVILVPDTLFLNLAAFGFLRSTTGTAGYGTASAGYYPSQYQTYVFTAAPYLQHRFGGTGTAEVGYTASYADYGSVLRTYDNPLLTPGQFSPYSASSHLFTQNEHATFVTGEDFGRLSAGLSLQADQYSGSSIYQGAHDTTELASLTYAINRHFSAMAVVGHESIVYPRSQPAVRIDDMIWQVGGKVTFGPTSSITGLYGHRYGESNVFVQGVTQPTGHLHVYVDVIQTLSTDLERLQNVAQTSTVTANGSLVDLATGAPVALADNFFAPNSAIYRLTEGAITGVLGYDRDAFSASAVAQSTKVIAQAPGQPFAASNRGYYFTVGWSHDFTPRLSGAASVTYGRSKLEGVTGSGYQSVYGANLSLLYRLTETLFAQAVYSYERNPSYAPYGPATQNLALITLTKQF